MNTTQTFKAIALMAVIVLALGWAGASFVSTAVPLERMSAQATGGANEVVLTDQRTLEGYAWSSNIGWISLGGPTYSIKWTEGASVQPMTGHAWANPYDGVGKTNNIGWIKFNPTDSYPTNSTASYRHGVQIEGAGTPNPYLTGWARACVAAPDTGACSGAGSNESSAGWDGWINMKGTAQNGQPYGVKIETNPQNKQRLAGYAWGGDTVGWLRFSLSDSFPPGDCDPRVSVCINNPNVTQDPVATCSALESPSVTTGTSVTWQGSIIRGEPNFTYEWSDTAFTSPISHPNIPLRMDSVTVEGGYSATGTKKAVLKVTDSTVAGGARTAEAECTINVTDTPDNPVNPTSAGTLTVDSTDGIIYIRNQASGKPALTIDAPGVAGLKITNNGTAPVNLTQIKIVKQNNSALTLDNVISPDGFASCVLGGNAADEAPLQKCTDWGGPTAPFSLAPLQSVYLRVRIPKPLKDIADNNPYVVSITGQSPYINSLGNPASATVNASKTIIFDYLVSTFDPR